MPKNTRSSESNQKLIPAKVRPCVHVQEILGYDVKSVGRGPRILSLAQSGVQSTKEAGSTCPSARGGKHMLARAFGLIVTARFHYGLITDVAPHQATVGEETGI